LAKILLILFFVSIPVYCTGESTAMSGDSWILQWDIPRVMIGSLFLIIAFFLIRTLNKIDSNQTNLFERLRTAEVEIAVVKDRCDSAMACIARKGDNG